MEFGIIYLRNGSDSPEEGACVGDHVEDIGVGNQLLAKFPVVGIHNDVN